MKKRTMLFLILLLFLLAGGVSNVAAQDSGEERTIDVTVWKCWQCGQPYYTFAPDDIAGAKTQNKDFNFQKAAWRILKNGSPIKKCEKSPDGAHFMEKKGDIKTSGLDIMRKAESYIVVRGGSAIKAPILIVRCAGCGKGACCFKGDDLDEWESFSLTKVSHVYAMKSASPIGSCDKILLPIGHKLTPHLFGVETAKSMKSEEILEKYGSFLCSD